MDQSGLASRPVRNASSGGRRRSWDQVRLFSLFCCARWRRMVGLDRIARPLLSIVKGKRHATTEDHEPDNKRAPDSANADSESESDNDNDRSGLGQLPKKKPTRLHVPQHNRTTGSSVIPAKRGAEPDDELDNSSFKSSSSQSKPTSFRDTPTLQSKPEPPRKRAVFRTHAPTEPFSSQQDAPSTISAPSFRPPTNATTDRTDISNQSEPIILESSQLSPPPSSPISSVCDFDLEQPVEDLDKRPRCPICAERIEQEFWDKFQDDINYRRMNLSLQEKFCQAHKARTADDVWLDRGYPKIDWSALRSRLDAHQDHIHAILDGDYESPFYKQHAKLVTDIKNRSNTSAVASGRFTGLRAGYYGTKGEKIMAENIIQTFSDKLRSLSRTDPLMASGGASGGVSGYVHAILVPELALGLIMEDMNCDRDKAQIILADSADIGELFNAEEDEKVPQVEIDLLDTNSVNHDSEIVYTKKPRKGFRLA
ncbi:hypothetical protein E4T50_05640 [Aureobasidium sp. EXF-12298]|nr:hypothetical protein E4T50_05640 [Aureobasidium sp. EXF-12298]KAI4761643.1 hypothetical protein E4T51_05407 [Aureobasidium sp. EXF-12344]KAI4778902.1 hypothetical protein E4T52_06203 [Aureobasidium sp. EXF-3400]